MAERTQKIVRLEDEEVRKLEILKLLHGGNENETFKAALNEYYETHKDKAETIRKALGK